MTTKQTRARLAGVEVSFELNRITDEIRRVDEDIADSYLSRELALYRKLLANRATALSMASSLRRCRLHAEKITIGGREFKFQNLSTQADFLQWVVSTPYSVLSNKQKRLVADIVIGYDELDALHENRLTARLERRRQLTRDRRKTDYQKRLQLKPAAKLLTSGTTKGAKAIALDVPTTTLKNQPQFAGTNDLPY